MKTSISFNSKISESVLYLTQRLKSYPAVCLLVRSGTLDLNYIGAIHQKIPISDIPHCSEIPQNNEVCFYEVTIEGIPVIIYETPNKEIEHSSFLYELYPIHVIAHLGIRCLFTIDQLQFLTNVSSKDSLIIKDHLNLTGIHPLSDLKYSQDYKEKMRKFSMKYATELQNLCEQAFEKQKIEFTKSILLGVSSTETTSKAERNLYESWNADCIGNIHVLEAIVARYYSMHICTLVIQKNHSSTKDSTLLNERRQHLYGIINFILPNIYQFLATTSNEIS